MDISFLDFSFIIFLLALPPAAAALPPPPPLLSLSRPHAHYHLWYSSQLLESLQCVSSHRSFVFTSHPANNDLKHSSCCYKGSPCVLAPPTTLYNQEFPWLLGILRCPSASPGAHHIDHAALFCLPSPYFSATILPHAQGFPSDPLLPIVAMAAPWEASKTVGKSKNRWVSDGSVGWCISFLWPHDRLSQTSWLKTASVRGSQFCRAEVLMFRGWVLCSESHRQNVLMWSKLERILGCF